MAEKLANKVAEKLVAQFAELKEPIAVEEPLPEAEPVVAEEPLAEAEPVVEEEPIAEAEPVVEEEPIADESALEITESTELTQITETTETTKTAEPTATPVAQEKPSPKAAIYGKAVDDIRLAISLGDRFLYQRELFGQNAERMQRTLTELNELSSFDEAMDYIARFNWDTESKTYQQFLVTLHRRFG